MKTKRLFIFLISTLFLNCRAGSIELIAFTGEESDGYVTLNWQTRTEYNLKSLSVETSQNAIDFTQVAEFISDGSSSIDKIYIYKDVKPTRGINYYRLKETDVWGNIKYFKIIAVNYTKQLNATFFPNPINNKEFTVKLSGTSETVLNISNSNGRIVYSQSFPVMEVEESINVKLPQLDSGTYLFTLYSKEVVSTQRMFITE